MKINHPSYDVFSPQKLLKLGMNYYRFTNMACFWWAFHSIPHLCWFAADVVSSMDLPPCGFREHRTATSQQTTGHSKAFGQFLQDHLKARLFRDTFDQHEGT